MNLILEFLTAFWSNLLSNTLLCPQSWIVDSHCPGLWILQRSVLGLLLFTLYTLHLVHHLLKAVLTTTFILTLANHSLVSSRLNYCNLFFSGIA